MYFGEAMMYLAAGVWLSNIVRGTLEKEEPKKEIVPIIPGLYKAKRAKNTVIEVFDEYSYDGKVRISLKEGSAIIEDENGVGLMGLMPDSPGKKRYYPTDVLTHEFSLVQA